MPGPKPPTDATERLVVAHQALTVAVASLGRYPCRISEMTAREAKIAAMVTKLIEAIQFACEVIREADDLARIDGGPPP